MPKYFNFENLIRKYTTTFTAIIPSGETTKGKGVWIAGNEQKASGEKEITLQGAIINHRLNKVFRSEGTITEQDRALFMLEPLENDLRGAKVVYEGNMYRIGDLLENSEYTGVYKYNLHFVSAFNGGDEK